MSQAKSAWIVEADEANFQQVAVERSREKLVVVDFWAQWCAPCRMLAPILEKLAEEYAGKFLLVKADTDKLPNIAAGFGVQSIPAVYAMREGQLLDFFMGVMPEEQLRAWLNRLLPSAAETLVAEARALQATDPAAAEAKYRQASELDTNLGSAKIGLAELLFAQGRTDESRTIVDELERRGFLEPEAERLKAQLHLASPASSDIDLDALRREAADAKNVGARLKLAEAVAAQGSYQEALDLALAVVQAGKKDYVDPARQLMVDIFRLLGDEDPLVPDYRRRLSMALY